MKNLCLIDGYGFVFRAYHSLPPLLSPDNLPVSAVYGFLNMIVKILKEHEYDHIGIVLDSGKKNFRHDISPEHPLFGRRCYIDGINDKNHNIRQFSERAAINAPLQGTASDIIKKAMVELPSHINEYMVLQVHDELLFEVPENKAAEYSENIKNIMENAIS